MLRAYQLNLLLCYTQLHSCMLIGALWTRWRKIKLLVSIIVILGAIYFHRYLIGTGFNVIFILGGVFSIGNHFIFNYFERKILQNKDHLKCFNLIKMLIIGRLIIGIILSSLISLNITKKSFIVALLISFIICYL